MKCGYCSRQFSKPEHLRRHERSHTGVKPFACTVCKRAFSRLDSLQRHERIHKHGRTPDSLAWQSARVPTPDSTNDSVHQLPTPSSQVADLAPPIQYDSYQTTGQTSSEGIPEVAAADALPFDLDFDLIWSGSHDLFQSLLVSPAQISMEPLVEQQWIPPLPTDKPSHSVVGASQQPFMNQSPMIDSTNPEKCHDALANINSVFLDESLHMFFVRFIPVLPILHRPTFVFKDCSQLLLLNAIAIGSLYLGPKDSISKGESLWHVAQSALSTSWQQLINHKGKYDPCSGQQLVMSAFLSQLYGTLSKNRQIRSTSQASHSTTFFWARQSGMFAASQLPVLIPDVGASVQEKEGAWRRWVAGETHQRTLLALYMLDGLVSLMSGDPVSERHTSNPLAIISNEAAFNAASADDWIHVMLTSPTPSKSITFRSAYQHIFSPLTYSGDFSIPVEMSPFAYKVILESFQSLISEHDVNGDATFGVPDRNQIAIALLRLHSDIQQAIHLPREEKLEIELRWHSLCLENTVKSSTLCHSLCRNHGVQQSLWGTTKDGTLDISSWSSTPSARGALLHATAIQDIVEQLPRGRAHAIHMPSALFAAATVYAALALSGLTSVRLPSTVQWDQVLPSCSGLGSETETARYMRGERLPGGFMTTTALRNLLYELNSMQKLFRCLYTQWGVAFDMEAIVDAWVKLCHL